MLPRSCFRNPISGFAPFKIPQGNPVIKQAWRRDFYNFRCRRFRVHVPQPHSPSCCVFLCCTGTPIFSRHSLLIVSDTHLFDYSKVDLNPALCPPKRNRFKSILSKSGALAAAHLREGNSAVGPSFGQEESREPGDFGDPRLGMKTMD